MVRITTRGFTNLKYQDIMPSCMPCYDDNTSIYDTTWQWMRYQNRSVRIENYSQYRRRQLQVYLSYQLNRIGLQSLVEPIITDIFENYTTTPREILIITEEDDQFDIICMQIQNRQPKFKYSKITHPWYKPKVYYTHLIGKTD